MTRSHIDTETTTSRRRIAPVEVLGFALAGILMISSMGCGFTGESGNLRFVYETSEFSGKRPVAVGAQVQLNTYENVEDSNSDEFPVEVTDVTSSDPGVFTVPSVGSPESNAFRLRAEAAGSADITVEGETETGATISDTFEMSAAEATSVEFEHPCENESSTPVYLTDQPHVVNMRLESSDGSSLVGWGYRPVEVNGPSSAYQVDESIKLSDRLGLTFGSQSGQVTINSTLDNASITLEAVQESAIDEMDWFASSNGTPSLFPTSSDAGHLFPSFRSNGRVACNARVDLSYSVQTPNVCSVETEHLAPEANLLTEIGETQTAVKVTEHSDDTCRFDVTVSQASSVSKSVELDLASDGPDEQQGDDDS